MEWQSSYTTSHQEGGRFSLPLRCLCLVLLLVVVTVLPSAGANSAAGSITVRSVPGGISVTLDGVYLGQTPLGNDVPAIGNIEPGPHQLVLSKSGDADEQYPFWIGSGQRGDIRITLSTTTSQTAAVSLVSSPPGADILFDGGYRGRTPITLGGLTTGRHQVELERPGCIRYTDTVEVRNGVTTSMDPVPTPTSAVGLVSVISTPEGALVDVDRAYRGITPLTVAITAGTRQIELDHPGYADWTSTAQVTTGATVQVNAYLQLLPASSNGGIAVSSEPAGAAEYLDDRYRGVRTAFGDLELTGLTAGSHAHSVRLDGYNEYHLAVPVMPDATVKVRPRLAVAGNPTVTATTTVLGDRGAIQANSTPPGARAALVGSDKGTTPGLDHGCAGRYAHRTVLARRRRRAGAVSRESRDPDVGDPNAGRERAPGPRRPKQYLGSAPGRYLQVTYYNNRLLIMFI